MGGVFTVVADVFMESAAFTEVAASDLVASTALDEAAALATDAATTGNLDAATTLATDAVANTPIADVAETVLSNTPETSLAQSTVPETVTPELALSTESQTGLTQAPPVDNYSLTRSLAPSVDSLDPMSIANSSADPIGTLNAANNWTGTMTNNIGQIATEMASQGYSESAISQFLQTQYGIDQYAAGNAAGIASAGGDASTIAEMLARDYGLNMTGLQSTSPITLKDVLTAGKDVISTVNAVDTASKLLTGNSIFPTGAKAQTGAKANVSSSGNPYAGISGALSGGGGSGSLPGLLRETMLQNSAPQAANTDAAKITQLKQLYPQLAGVDPRILSSLTAPGPTGAAQPTTPSYYTYGSGIGGGGGGFMGQRSGSASNQSPLSSPMGLAKPLTSAADSSAAGLNMINKGFSPLDHLNTGLTPIAFKKGGGVHRPEFITGETGHFVEGRGDGQSDGIPAMLADGEYVFDADTVAALGNGSSKAGAEALDKMREEIRKHKRSAPNDKIPPKAKSPLQYLKG